MHSVARCGQGSMATMLMVVTIAILMKMKSNQKAKSVRLEGSANVGPPLIKVPTIVNILEILKQ